MIYFRTDDRPIGESVGLILLDDGRPTWTGQLSYIVCPLMYDNVGEYSDTQASLIIQGARVSDRSLVDFGIQAWNKSDGQDNDSGDRGYRISVHC